MNPAAMKLADIERLHTAASVLYQEKAGGVANAARDLNEANTRFQAAVARASTGEQPNLTELRKHQGTITDATWLAELAVKMRDGAKAQLDASEVSLFAARGAALTED